MARVPDITYIRTEDFDGDQKKMIDRIAFPVNTFMEQTSSALDRSLDFQNLNRELITLDITVDANGNPTTQTRYSSNLKSRVAGHNCISAINTTNPLVYPTSQPFISFIQNTNLVTINNVSGLQANQKYQIVLESIGR